VFKQAGINLGGGNTDTIAKQGTRVSVKNMRPGDIVFFDTYKKNGHVGIYLGNGKFIGSQSKGVSIEDLTTGHYKKVFNGYVIRV
jgi:cell wall-associated NlpC family hydrolase